MHTGRICGVLRTKMADCPAWSISQGRATHYMGADIRGPVKIGGRAVGVIEDEVET